MTDTLTLAHAVSIIASVAQFGCSDPDKFETAKIVLALNRLKNAQKFVLVEHALGPRPVLATEAQTVTSLIDRGLLRYTTRAMRPTTTEATDEGRAVIAKLLARWADVLSKRQAEKDAAA